MCSSLRVLSSNRLIGVELSGSSLSLWSIINDIQQVYKAITLFHNKFTTTCLHERNASYLRHYYVLAVCKNLHWSDYRHIAQKLLGALREVFKRSKSAVNIESCLPIKGITPCKNRKTSICVLYASLKKTVLKMIKYNNNKVAMMFIPLLIS